MTPAPPSPNGETSNDLKPETASNGQENTEICSSKTIKLPQFWNQCPATWFITVENSLDLEKITSNKSKYQHVLAALPQHVAMRVSDIIRNGKRDYDQLKNELISRFSISEEQRLNTLLSESNAVIGDRRPSEFFLFLEQIANSGTNNTSINNELLIKLWMRRLPDNIYTHLVASGEQDESKLVPMADRMWDSMHRSTIASISNTNQDLAAKHTSYAPTNSNAFPLASTSTLNTSCSQQLDNDNTMRTCISELCQQISTLRNEINEIKQQRDYRGRPRFRSHTPSQRYSRSAVRSRSRTNPDMCWYHNRFGANANKCQKPCNYNQSKNE